MQRAVAMLVTIGIILGAAFGAIAAFYFLAALAGAVSVWLLGGHPYVGITLVNIVTILLVFVMVTASMLTLAERKWSAFMQDRVGPNRARFGIVPGLANQPLGGLPHFLADGIKMLTKEDFIPPYASKLLFALGPILSFAPVFCLFAVVPLAPTLDAGEILPAALAKALTGSSYPKFDVALMIAPRLDIGVLFLFGIASLAVYGTALAGWSSNNKLGLLGAVRASAQMISYEVALGLSLVGCFMAYGTLRLDRMGDAQVAGLFDGALPAWGIFLQPLGFLLFFAAAFAETKRAPFDAPEGESEIVGYFVEYSGMRFGLFMISEFVEIVVLSGVIAAVFFGGFHLPDTAAWGLVAAIRREVGPFWLAVLQGTTFIVKVLLLCWLQLAIRWTMPRFRYDQIQTLGWKILLPIGLANVFVTGALILFDPSLDWLAIVGLGMIAVLLGITLLYRPAKPPTVTIPHPRGGHGTHSHAHDEAHAAHAPAH